MTGPRPEAPFLRIISIPAERGHETILNPGGFPNVGNFITDYGPSWFERVAAPLNKPENSLALIKRAMNLTPNFLKCTTTRVPEKQISGGVC